MIGADRAASPSGDWIVTGANRGLGLEIARNLAARVPGTVVLAVRDPDAGRAAVAEQPSGRFEVGELDLARRTSVEGFIDNWDRPLAGLINNAGLQIADGERFTDDGLELTFAVNHLHALRLALGLLPWLRGGRVMFIGSGTHNPRHPVAPKFGFRGERYTSIRACAEGIERGGNHGQLGKDRYATSKFLNMATTVELARRYPADQTRFICLDPGLMPGTGLARTAPAPLRFAWSYLLPIVARLLPDSSTTARSGRAAADLMTTPSPAHGEIFDFNLKPSKHAIDRIRDPEIGREVVDDSLALLDR